jgi:hypothetical protein
MEDIRMTQTTFAELEARVAAWVDSNEGQEALKRTAERARKTSQRVIQDAMPTDEQLRRRVTI